MTSEIDGDIDEVEELMEVIKKSDSSKKGKSPVIEAPMLKNFLLGVSVSDDLKVDPFNLDEGLTEQAGLYAWYSVAASKAQYQYERAKANAAFVEANMGSKIRQAYIKAGKKPSEKMIESEVIMSAAFQAAESTMNKARQIYNHCRAVADSMEQRQQMLIQACKRYELEMTMSGTFKSREQRVSDALKKSKAS